MASDTPGEGSAPPTLPPAVREWVGDVAADAADREELLAELLADVARAGDDDSGGADDEQSTSGEDGEFAGDEDATGVADDDGVVDAATTTLDDADTGASDGPATGDADTGDAEGQDAGDVDAAMRLAAALHADVEATVAEHLQRRDDVEGLDTESLAADVQSDMATEFVTSADLDDRIEGLEEEFRRLLEDVRDRVVQVKQEADAKAPADHGHGDLEDRLDDLAGTVADLEATVGPLREEVDGGFENFERIAERLADAVDDLAARQDTLARALVETRDHLQRVEAREHARSAAASLRRTANREGITAADCGVCGEQVALGLLTDPTCPHCAARLTDIEPASGFFGRDELVAEEQPALEPGERTEGFEFDLAGIVEADPPETETEPDG